jgi:formate-dependent nitrite reductase membrane component NrfD
MMGGVMNKTTKDRRAKEALFLWSCFAFIIILLGLGLIVLAFSTPAPGERIFLLITLGVLFTIVGLAMLRVDV